VSFAPRKAKRLPQVEKIERAVVLSKVINQNRTSTSIYRIGY